MKPKDKDATERAHGGQEALSASLSAAHHRTDRRAFAMGTGGSLSATTTGVRNLLSQGGYGTLQPKERKLGPA